LKYKIYFFYRASTAKTAIITKKIAIVPSTMAAT